LKKGEFDCDAINNQGLTVKRPLKRVRRLIPYPARVTGTSAAAIRVV